MSAIKSFEEHAGLRRECLQAVNDGVLQQHALTEIAQWDLGDIAPRIRDAATVSGVDVARLAYAHVPLGAQLQVALYTALLILADDFRVPAATMAAFSGRLFSGLPQLHPVFDRLVEIMHRMEEFYLPFAVNQIIRSTAAFMDSMVADNEVGQVPLGPASLAYINSRRIDNGNAEAYGYLLWDKFSFPRLETYIQIIA